MKKLHILPLLLSWMILAANLHALVQQVFPLELLLGSTQHARTTNGSTPTRYASTTSRLRSDGQDSNEERNDLQDSIVQSDNIHDEKTTQKKTIFMISDATGVTARSALSKALVQFDHTYIDEAASTVTPAVDPPDDDDEGDLPSPQQVQTRSFTFVRSRDVLDSILQKAVALEACILYTFVDDSMRQQVQSVCEEHSLAYVDLLGPCVDALSVLLQQSPSVQERSPSSPTTRKSSPSLTSAYYDRIQAVEFTLQADDGQAPWLLEQADVVLVGVSRSGKTPLSVVLSQLMGYQVANVPLVLECPPPQELLRNCNPQRVFCLTLAPQELRQIRTTRLERSLLSSFPRSHATESATTTQNRYADRAYLLNDLKHARELAQAHGWTEIDVTGRAVEETAAWITEMMNQRFGVNHDRIL